MPFAVGSKVGSYEVVAAIGAGGMGEVFRARDTKLGRDVALKVLPASFTEDPERLARFQREAQILATLNHPNIAAIYGLEHAAAIPFLVLELVEGEPLDRTLQHGAVPIDDALRLARQIADALEAAHEKGIVHRDLKPANIVVTHDGVVKVLDFGLAKAMERTTSGELSQSPTITFAATQAGVILGTAAYMSPEQAKGRAADKRTDVWAFGCVLFEMLTGKRAFEGEDVTETIAAIVRGEPDWSVLPAGVPDQIRLLIRRCLDKDRRTRTGDIAVARFLMTETIAAPPPPATGPPAAAPIPGWRRALPFVATAAAAAAVVTAAFWFTRQPPAPLQVARFSFTPGEGRGITALRGRFVSISPDGGRIVYVANRQLYVRELASFESGPIAGTQTESPGILSPVFSPDGRSIAFIHLPDRSLKRVPITGGSPITICPVELPLGISWDSTGIVFAQANGIFRVSPTGGKPEPIASVGPDEFTDTPQMLPNGTAVLFALAKGTAPDRWEHAQIVAQPLKSGERKLILDAAADPRYVSTGHLLFGRAGTVFAAPFDAARLAITGPEIPVIEGVRRASAVVSTAEGSPLLSGAAQFSVSTNGSLVYVPGPAALTPLSQDIAFVDRSGSVEHLNLPKGAYRHVRMAPDGRRIVFAAADANGASSVYVYEVGSGTAMRRLTFEGNSRFPIWTPDGKRITFQSDREGGGIFQVPADGNGTAERLTRADAATMHVPESWSPAGDVLLYGVAKGQTVTLWMFSTRDKTSTRFDAVEAGIPIGAAFSPDGRWVAYGADNMVYVQPFPPTGAKYQVPNATGAHHPFWSPDGTELFYEPGIQRLDVVPFRTEPAVAFGNPTSLRAGLIGSTNPAFSRNRDIDAQGKHFVAPVSADQAQPELATEFRVVINWLDEMKARLSTK